jgi:hypothetical protein
METIMRSTLAFVVACLLTAVLTVYASGRNREGFLNERKDRDDPR